MKKLVFFALILIAQTSAAQTVGAHTAANQTLWATASQTHFQIEPYFPADCQKHDYPLLNRVADIRRISETKKSVVFQFRAFVGACHDGQFLPTSKIAENASVGTYKNRLVLFQKETPVLSSVQPLTAHEALITLQFDKPSAFKKRNVQTYTMNFYPQGYPRPIIRTDAWGRSSFYQPFYIVFPWKVILTKVSVDETTIHVGVGQP